MTAQAYAIWPGQPLPLDGTPWAASGGGSTARPPPMPRQMRVIRVDLPDGTAVYTSTLSVVAPTHPRYQVQHSLEAVYVVTSTAREETVRYSLGSDYLLSLLHAGTPPAGGQKAAGAQGVAARAPVTAQDVASPSSCRAEHLTLFLPASIQPAFITSEGNVRRLGDGAYEQRVVATQVQALIGKPVMSGHLSLQAQYRELLTAGTDFALRHGLMLGAALTRDHMLKIKKDMVWLVEYPVSMPDGSVRVVLVPQVYVLRREDWR
ncbi:hypothetical protein [Bordetella sp. LUAb4]|uniref:hypothetical protein n=1 Tax=Bordetella sp. LUAb4 TaxID=2843195 RepID=UPI001E5622CF|nr:hypothetical protein [Bordetella sp. LUAb4]